MVVITSPLSAVDGAADQRSRPVIADDMAMLRGAVDLTKDLNAVNPAIYWADFLGSAAIGYGALAVAVRAEALGMIIGAALVAVLALYRAGSFIHELTHIKHSSLPWFRFGWNALIGIPLLVPSFMYEGVHTLHHARTRYGTAEDPEYLPLALMKPWTLPLFVLVTTLAPMALLFRYAILAPLSAFIPPLRTLVVERYSGFIINPAFRRRPPEGELKQQWLCQEIAASLWAMTILVAVATRFVSVRSFLIALAIVSILLVINQIRTLAAHLWENEGEAMTVTAQFLDSVNVPPPALLPALWAPVGLRYHAIHHLLPSLPYHALGEAHRRLSKALASDSKYHRANYSGLPTLILQLARATNH